MRPCRADGTQSVGGAILAGINSANECEIADLAVGVTGSLCREGDGYTTPFGERPARIVSGGVSNFPVPVPTAGARPSKAGNSREPP